MPTDRITRQELRELLIAAGTEVLLEEGMRCGLDHVTFPRVFDRVQEKTGRRVTRASVYDRLWTSQEEFQWEVLAHVIEDAGSIDQRTRRRVNRILAEADYASEAGRRAGLRDLCQLAVEQHVIEASRRQHYRIAMAAVGAIASSEGNGPEPPHVKQVRESLTKYLERETDLYLELYGHIGFTLGFQMREPLELRHLVLAVGALGEGIALRLNFFPEYAQKIKVPAADGGADAVWSIAGVGVEAIAETMLELDPDWSVERLKEASMPAR
ncbi:MAG: hypothetical protein HYX32_04475 [Actinobacteria bacterium]|nr:hypothetical protein [Actinomycetota bacterium]